MPHTGRKPLSRALMDAATLHKQGKNSEAIESLKILLNQSPASLRAAEQRRLLYAMELLQGSPSCKPKEKQTITPYGASLSNQSSWPRISIVTPTFNQGVFIEETIQSIIGQGYPNLEYIIVDGGSNDDTLTRIDKFRHLIDIIISEPDNGQSDAINKGMRVATGDILYWLNSDDILEANTLLHVGWMYREGNFDLLVGTCTCFDDLSKKFTNRHIATLPFGLRVEDITDIKSTWLRGMYFHQPEVFFSRRLWETAGGHVKTDLHFSMDYDLWARMAIHGLGNAGIRISGKSFCMFRQHREQKTSTVEAYLPELLSHSRLLADNHLKGKPLSTFKIASHYKSKLSIVAISDFGFNGGAGKAHKRICQALKSAGHDIIQLSGFDTWQSEKEEINIQAIVDAVKIIKPDLVILGNVHNLKYGLAIAGACVSRFPTIAIAHDFWWVTGRCAYTKGCHYLMTTCNQACPTAAEYPHLDRDLIQDHHLRKKNLWQNPNFYMLANSKYTEQTIRKALSSWRIQHNNLGTVPLPITAEGSLCFDDCDLDGDGKNEVVSTIRIVFGCTDNQDFRKGADIGSVALGQLLESNQDIVVDVFGENCDHLLNLLPQHINHINLYGLITDQQNYQSMLLDAHIFLGTSRDETLGQTFVEAANAGLITVGPLNTGYSDVYEVCPFSLGYQGFDPVDITACLLEAIHILHTTDRNLVRSLQNAQAKSRFSGISFVSAFHNHLYQSGLWKRLGYHGPTKIHHIDYYSLEISEIILANKQAVESSHMIKTPCREHQHQYQERVGIANLRLGPELYLEDTDDGPLVWLKKNSTVIFPLPKFNAVQSISFHCKWIPLPLRGTACRGFITGIGAVEGIVPNDERGQLEFNCEQFQISAKGCMILMSLSFTKSYQLEDGRTDLALTCSEIIITGIRETLMD
jgi:glycosyltransferase involved in cell wall biosynthesis